MSVEPHAHNLRFRYAVRSDVGIVRENNEDSAYASEDFLVLADGMGGHASGEVASAVAVHTYATHTGPSAQEYEKAATTTRKILRAMSKADETLLTMGTTVVALAASESGFLVSHIGDSRIYLQRGGELTQITTDHTHVQHLVETGRITREEVSTHPYRAMLLKSLDDQPGGAAPDTIPLELRSSDRVLLCSDGLSDYVSEYVIAEILLLPDLDEAADELIQAALRSGTRDNITVIVADVTDDAPSQAGAGEPAYAGAAAEPLRVSDPAQSALYAADPEFTTATASQAQGDREGDQVIVTAQTTPAAHTSPAMSSQPVDPARGSGSGRRPLGPAVFAVIATVVVGVAIALIL